MANSEHLAILKHGVETWNRWGHENSDAVPDLTRGYFIGSYLKKRLVIGRLGQAHYKYMI